jgi:RNA polymerase sigma factor (TIGR02999 family)
MVAAHASRVDRDDSRSSGTATDAEIPRLLDDIRAGRPEAMRDLYARLYDELRRLARSHRRRWNGNETMNTTAIVHEAYLKLAGNASPGFENRLHFFATASMAMRQVLVNYAEHRRAAKSGGGVVHVPLEDDDVLVAESAIDELLDLDKALCALEAESPRRGRIVECRLFGGMSVEETAAALDISPATVKREWQVASAVLTRETGRLG